MKRRWFCLLPLPFVGSAPAQAGWLDIFNGAKVGQQIDMAGLKYPGLQPSADRRLTMLYFWATWCGPCRVSMPHLNALQLARAEQGLSIVAVTSETEAEVSRFAAAVPMRMAVGLDGERRLFKALGIRGVPYAVLVDREGVVRWSGQDDELSATTLDGLLAAAKPKAV